METPMHTLALLTLLACGETSPDNTPAAEPAPADVAPEPAEPNAMKHPRPQWEVRQHMDLHFTFATDALFLAFAGDLEGLHAEARKLAEHDALEEAPEAWKPFMEKMYTRADELQRAGSIEEASKSLALLAASCAECHQADKGPDVSLKGLAYDESLFGDSAMDRHEWAAYLMWIGLVVPDDEIYTAGTKALAHSQDTMPEHTEASKKMELHLHDLGGKAFKAKTPEERQEAFAAFVATCAGCHEANDVMLPIAQKGN
jgi:mono/diheme cytochrome c family protein